MIYTRLRDGKDTDITLSTSKTIDPKFWGIKGVKAKAEFSDKLNLQSELNRLQSKILSERNDAISQNIKIDKEWLENLILDWQGKNTTNKSDVLIQLIENHKLYLKTRVRDGKIGVEDGTIRNYSTTVSRLARYEKHHKTKLRLTDLDLRFHSKYVKFAQDIMRLGLNSIGKDIKNIKAVCNSAKDENFKINPQVFSSRFSAPSEKTIFTTLSEAELNTIKGTDLNGLNYLENARDWLLIGCWTGCRVGDLLQFNLDNLIYHSSGKKILQYTQNKGGKMVNVPLHPHVEEIIERLGGFPRKISDQRFNDYIKIVCLKAGLTYKVKGTKQNEETHLKEVGTFEKWQLIRTHTCRRSFATNHYNKMTNKQIMHITGHATERMLLAYIGEVDSEHIDDFLDLWSKEAKENSEKIVRLTNLKQA